MIKLSKWLMLTMPIVFLFYRENGLGTQELFVLKAVYSFVIVVFEIPSGYIGDAWGRKNAMIVGAVLGTVGFGIYCFARGFNGFLVAEIVLGVGQSFISGSDSALLYDSLVEAKKEPLFLETEGRLISVGNYAEAIAAPLGVLLAAASLRTPYVVQALIAFSAIPAALTLREPVHIPLSSGNVKGCLGNILHAECIQNKQMLWNILFSATTGTAALAMTWFVQPLFAHYTLPLPLYGCFIPVLNLTAGTFSRYAHAIEKKLGFESTLFCITMGISLVYLAIGWIDATWGLIFLMIASMVRGVAAPVLNNHINRVTPSVIRATVLSIRNMIIRLTFVVAGPVLGWSVEKQGLSSVLFAGGIVFFVSGFIAAKQLMASVNRHSPHGVAFPCRLSGRFQS